jgi:hypothetical protein
MVNEEKPTKTSQPTSPKAPPPIVVKPGGSESGTKLRMFEAYDGEKKRELKK